MKRVVALASRVPTADNCQPWTFQWDGSTLAICHHNARAQHDINHNNHLSYLNLGCVLEALALASTSAGLAVVEEHLFLGDPTTSIWARVRLEESDAPAHELVEAIEYRCADRRLYRGGSLKHPVFAQLERDAARFQGNALYLLDSPSRELLEFCVAADAYVWKHEPAYRDTLRWFCFSTEEMMRRGDGVCLRQFGYDFPDIPGLQLVRNKWVRQVMDLSRLYTLSGRWVRALLTSSAGLACITARSRRREDLVTAGRLAFSTWLRLNRAGYGVQPLTLQSMPIYNLAQEGLPVGIPPEFPELYRRGRRLLEQDFGYSSGELPAWLFRTGLTRPMASRCRTVRLPVERMLSFTQETDTAN